ncbi:carboxy terminal-processing peptidase [Frateuria aurantia]
MKLRTLSTAILLAFTVTGAMAQSAADMGAGRRPHKESVFPLKPTEQEAVAAQLSARFLTRFHYDAQPLDDAMSAKIYDAFIKELDGDKMQFTQADLAKLKPYRTQLDDAIWNDDLSAPFDIFNQYVQHAIQHWTYARSLLAKGFDFSGHEVYQYNRKKADWAPDEASLDELWRKRTMNDWLRLKLAGKTDEQIRQLLEKRYTGYIERTKQVDDQDAFQSFMTAYAETTDPHTDYMGPREAEQFDIMMRLSLEGIGAQLMLSDDYVAIAELVAGGPAIKSGKLHVGDRISAVGQGVDGPMVDVVGWRLDDVVNLIRGKKGSTVRLDVIPADKGLDAKPERIVLVRQTIQVEDMAASKKIINIKDASGDHKIGVIDLPSFYSDFDGRQDGDKNYKSATRDVAKLIGELKQAGVEGIVMDLRDDGGGSLTEANQMTGLFIDKGPVVQVRDSRGRVDVQGDDQAGMAWDGPLAVLVNRGSASASEIFTAAIKDYGRGLVIGTPTFGKGTVQNLVNLDRIAQAHSDKSQYGELKMTIAEFFRINGGSTQLKGVTPDIEYPKTGAEKEFGESTYDNALPWTQIAPANYQPVARIQPYLAKLQADHDARVAQSPAWKLMLDELAAYQKLRDQTSTSLNFAQREAERKQLDAQQAEFRARHKLLDGKNAKDDDDTAQLDDGLDPNERSLKTMLKEEKSEKDAKNEADPELRETAHVLADAYDLIKSDPSLATQVLPYGGKFGNAWLKPVVTVHHQPVAASASSAAAKH